MGSFSVVNPVTQGLSLPEQGDYNLVRPKVNAVYLINCLSLWESVTNMYPGHHPLPSLEMPLSFNVRCDYGDS